MNLSLNVSRARAFRTLLLSTSAATLAFFAPTISAQAAEPQIEEIVVTGINLARLRAMEIKRSAEAVMDAVAADDLGRLPDKNSAEALARLPGVNITQDQGEGRYVSIRGASPNLNSITMNGLAVGTVEENSRRVPLDILGGELLGGLEVVKAVTPDMEANAIGGFINVKTPSPFDFEGAFFGRGTVSISDDEYGDFHPWSGNVMAGGKFGSDETIGVILGASYTDRHYLTKGFYADDWRPVAGVERGMPESHKFNNYELDRERMSLTGALEIQPDENSLYFARVMWTEAQESEFRNRNRNYFSRVISPQPARFSIDAATDSGTYTNQRLRLELRAEDKLRRIGNFSVGGENKFDQWEVKYAASLIDNRMTEPNQNWVFQAPDTFSSGTWNMTPHLPEIRPNTAGIMANLGAIGLNSYTTQELIDDDEGHQAKLDVKYNIEGESFTGYIKGGALYRSTTKSQDINGDNYIIGTGGAGAFNVGLPNIAGTPLEGTIKGQYYAVGPRLNFDGLDAFTAANINNTVVLRRDAAASLSGGVLSDFETEEDVMALYAMGSFTFGEWTILGGGRYEQTDVTGTSFDFLNGTTVTSVTRDGKYKDFLPAIHVRYEPENVPFIARAAWTNTIGRPEFTDITARRTISRVVDPDTGEADGTISQGNPDLKSYESTNFDLSLEYYLDNGGIISAAGFYKEIDQFIFDEIVTQNDVTFEGQFYDTLVITTPLNAEKGKIKGVELNYQQQWSFLPGALSGLGGGASVTFVNSSIRARGRDDKIPFIGQADMVYTATLFYQYGPFEAVASMDWADDILVALGDDAANDFYDKSYGRLDVRTAYRITEHVSLFLDLLNLNDAALGEFQGTKDWVTRSETYGKSATFGATVKW